MKKFVIFICILSIFLITSACAKEEMYTLTDDDCEQNWALCTLMPDRSYPLLSAEPTKIAVLDSGIAHGVAALNKQVYRRYNALTDAPETNDQFGHGTMVASVIGAKQVENHLIGVNPNVALYDVQVLDEYGNGAIEAVVRGIEWSIEQKVDIIHLSFGFEKDDPKLKVAIEKALQREIIVVAAAGNTFGMATDYPAAYEGGYSISSIDENLQSDPFAARGKIDFVAPGVDVPVWTKNGEIEKQTGTSFAAAYATGALSILLQQEGQEVITNNLESYIKPLGERET